jgi:hypothetical protein
MIGFASFTVRAPLPCFYLSVSGTVALSLEQVYDVLLNF